MKSLVIVESPWAGLGANQVDERNLLQSKAAIYLRKCIRDSLARGEIPWASHAMFALSRSLYEEDADQRMEGIEIGKRAIKDLASKVVFYVDHGISPGMQQARTWAIMNGVEIEMRKIYGDFSCE